MRIFLHAQNVARSLANLPKRGFESRVEFESSGGKKGSSSSQVED